MTISVTGAAKKRTPGAFETAARLIGCDVPAVRAVVEVEASGSGFDPKARPKMLFEPHVFYRCLSGARRDRAVSDGLAYPKWKQAYPRDSYPRFLKACAIDETAAIQAASWGLPQILGENFKAAGYNSPQAMLHDFVEGEDEQIAAMAKFIVSNKLARALTQHDWATFARGYNGASYKKNAYHTKLEKAYAKHLSRHVEEIVEKVDPPAPKPEPVPTPNVEPVPTPPDGDPEVYLVQKRLKQMGYNPGGTDGRWGGLTAGAIAGFNNDRGRAVQPKIDDALKAELTKAEAEGFTRPIATERANPTSDKLAEKAPEIVPAKRNRLVTFIAGIGSLLMAAFNAVVSFFKDALEWLTPVKDFASDVPTWIWLAVAGAVALFIAYQANQGVTSITKSVQTGERP